MSDIENADRESRVKSLGLHQHLHLSHHFPPPATRWLLLRNSGLYIGPSYANCLLAHCPKSQGHLYKLASEAQSPPSQEPQSSKRSSSYSTSRHKGCTQHCWKDIIRGWAWMKRKECVSLLEGLEWTCQRNSRTVAQEKALEVGARQNELYPDEEVNHSLRCGRNKRDETHDEMRLTDIFGIGQGAVLDPSAYSH